MERILLPRCGMGSRVLALMCAIAMPLWIVESRAQSAGVTSAYPAKPIRIIVPFPPGGSNDIVARYIGVQ